MTSLGAAPSVTAVGEHTRLTLVGGVSSWRDRVLLRTGGGAAAASSVASSASAASASSSTDDESVATSKPADAPADEDATVTTQATPDDATASDPVVAPATTEPVGAASAPQDVEVAVEYGRILVSWSAPADTGGARVLDYRIEVTDAATGALVASRTGLLLRSTTVLTPLGGGDLRIRIAAITAAGTGEWSRP